MSFEEFRIKIELLIQEQTIFELLEYSYQPYSFGSGKLANRINGKIYLYTYNGRDNLLTLNASMDHEKYPNCAWSFLFKQEGLSINTDTILTYLNLL
jgi:hypothetical protein